MTSQDAPRPRPILHLPEKPPLRIGEDTPLTAFGLVACGGMGAECPPEEEESCLAIVNGELRVVRNTEDRDSQYEVIANLDLKGVSL